MADDLECVINIGTKFQQPDIVAVQNRLPLFLGHREFFEIGSFVAGEFLTAFRLVQRHAEHVEMIALAIAAAVQDIGARYIIIVSACHRCPPSMQASVVRFLL